MHNEIKYIITISLSCSSLELSQVIEKYYLILQVKPIVTFQIFLCFLYLAKYNSIFNTDGTHIYTRPDPEELLRGASGAEQRIGFVSTNVDAAENQLLAS